MAEYNPSKIIKDGNTYNFRDTTKIPLTGSNEISGSLIPSATDTYNFGSPSYQWNNAYIKSLTINGVACGDILTHNASEFVGVSGNQTIGGIKSFSNDIRISKASPFCNVFASGYIKGQAPTSNIYSGVRFFDDINSGSTNTITGGFEVEYNRDGYNKSYIASRNYAGENHKFVTVGLRVPNDDIRSIDFLPSLNGIVNLGTSTNKWKSFNGLNPGALSLPSDTVGMDLIGDVSVVGTEKKLSKDITVTGFAYVDVSFSSTSSNRLNLYNDTKKYGIWIPCNSGKIRQIMPISAGDRLEFNVLDEGSTINAIKIFTCQGNV